MSERTRYSDEELEEFRALILKKLDKAQRDYEQLKGAGDNSGDNDIQDTSPTFKIFDEGASLLSKEETGKLAERQEKFIKHLRDALVRIENKTYGLCRKTGILISKERLRAVPHATLSMDAKMEENRR
jgi:RNA polymerase-binding transcription factor DksA